MRSSRVWRGITLSNQGWSIMPAWLICWVEQEVCTKHGIWLGGCPRGQTLMCGQPY
ncbi:unnamed protein product [Linum tenue]|uniref:Uncharacterized protein n=1 Tax=Linum tenue TaxID=586396 RepID=A0AAV0ME69_9ROSI|nr:unnamed protein product [Linum tenue]